MPASQGADDLMKAGPTFSERRPRQYLSKTPFFSSPNSALEASWRPIIQVNKFQTNPSASHFLQNAKTSLLRLLKICPSPPAPPPGAFALHPQTTSAPPPPPPGSLLHRLGFARCSLVIPGICFLGLGHSQ